MTVTFTLTSGSSGTAAGPFYISGTTSVAAIYPKQLFSVKIPVPPIEIQQSIVERIESERQIIEGNKKLIEIYTQKIQDRINKIWGE